MNAKTEWVLGVLRAGPEMNKMGDPYSFSCTILRRGNTVEIIGASGTFTRETYRAIKETLRSEGIKYVKWDRVKNGLKKLITL